MKSALVFILFFSSTVLVQAQDLLTKFEESNYLETSTYEEGLQFYETLAASSEHVQISTHGLTDSGLPLHLVLVSADKDFDIESNRGSGRSILLINNAIHPGEPDGVEASQMLARDLVYNKKMRKLLDKTLVAIIPFYNIGGALNRNTGSRTNQNGPEEKGFRGNARNFDLNRDFIKNDTENSKSFSEIFHMLDPDVLVDTHVSNGADYQYVLTMVTPQADKLGEPLQSFLEDSMMPSLYDQMRKTAYEMTPYVNVWGSTPDKGWRQFFDAPRYSSGYAALFQTIAFQSETHMLKSFEKRTWATYHFLHEVLVYLDQYGSQLQELRKDAKEKIKRKGDFPIEWTIDQSDSVMIEFKGYEATYPISEVSGNKRLKYDRNQPFTKKVPYYDSYQAKTIVPKPDYYVIPQAWKEVIAALKRNSVHTEEINSDTTINVEIYTIVDYTSMNSPWEGHYFHRQVEISKDVQVLNFRKGDVLVPVNQDKNRYIVETLEPQGTDSFFRWNFFDSILQMKEGFSSYVFEDEASAILKANPAIKEGLEKKKLEDEKFRKNGYAQLRYIWMQTEHKEPSYNRYPIYRIVN